MVEIRVEDVAARLVAVTRWPHGHPEAHAHDVGGPFERSADAVAAAVQRAGGVVVGAPFLWHGGARHVADVVVGVPVAGLRVGDVAGGGDGDAIAVEVVRRPGGRAAVARAEGDADAVAGLRRELAVWLDVRQLEPADAHWEERLGDPSGDARRTVTRLVRPLA